MHPNWAWGSGGLSDFGQEVTAHRSRSILSPSPARRLSPRAPGALHRGPLDLDRSREVSQTPMQNVDARICHLGPSLDVRQAKARESCVEKKPAVRTHASGFNNLIFIFSFLSRRAVSNRRRCQGGLTAPGLRGCAPQALGPCEEGAGAWGCS